MEKFSYFTLTEYFGTLEPILDKVSGKLGFVVARNYRLMNEEVKNFREKTEELIKKYGDDDGQGSIRISDPEKAKKADEEYLGIGNLEIDVDILKIHEDDFHDADLTAREMINLEWMVDRSDPNKPTPIAVKPNESVPGDEDRFGI